MALGVGASRTSASSFRTDPLPARGVDQQVLHVRHAVAGRRDGGHVHVVGPPAGEDVADLLARDQGRGLAPDVPGGEAVATRGSQVGLHLDVRQVRLQRGVRVHHAVHGADPLLDLGRLLAQRREVGAEDPHDDGLAGAGEHLLDALAQVGLHVAVETGIALRRRVDRRQRLVVVDARVHADPVLAEVDAVHLVGEQGLPDVRAAVAHARDLPQVLAGRDGDAGLLRRGRARLAEPVHQEVALLEVGEQLASERSGRPAAPARIVTRAIAIAGCGRRISGREHRPVAALEHPQQRRLPSHQPSSGQQQQAQRRGERQRHDHRHQHGERVRRAPAAGRTTRTAPPGTAPAPPR